MTTVYSAVATIHKLPFNDFKHIPTRPEIEVVLGVLPAIELRRLEEGLDLLEPSIVWAMHWYDSERGWGYRASFRERVVCILHFQKGFFTMTLSVPLAREAEFIALRELTEEFRARFSDYKRSINAKWIVFRIRKRRDTEAALALLRLKLDDLRAKTSRRKK
ncbi:MAG: DUF3788 family protein [Bacteroidota bacterium]|nr:DUF3788 family protein [Bacteroidota bacterium]